MSDPQNSHYSDELWRMIDARGADDADVVAIDRELWGRFGETRGVMFTDLCGFSLRSAAFGITHFLQLIHELKTITYPIVEAHGGGVIKECGDSFLIVFPNADRTLASALAIQRACHARNIPLPEERRLLLCVGLGFGPVLRASNLDIFGTEVNAASKLGEDMATAGEILVTSGLRDGLSATHDVQFTPTTHRLPGVPETFRVTYGATVVSEG